MILGRLFAFLEERVEPLVAASFRRALLLKLVVFYLAHHVGAERSAMHLVIAPTLVAATVAGFSQSEDDGARPSRHGDAFYAEPERCRDRVAPAVDLVRCRLSNGPFEFAAFPRGRPQGR